jgi:hypothetical protein
MKKEDRYYTDEEDVWKVWKKRVYMFCPADMYLKHSTWAELSATYDQFMASNDLREITEEEWILTQL